MASTTKISQCVGSVLAEPPSSPTPSAGLQPQKFLQSKPVVNELLLGISVWTSETRWNTTCLPPSSIFTQDALVSASGSRRHHNGYFEVRSFPGSHSKSLSRRSGVSNPSYELIQIGGIIDALTRLLRHGTSFRSQPHRLSVSNYPSLAWTQRRALEEPFGSRMGHLQLLPTRCRSVQ